MMGGEWDLRSPTPCDKEIRRGGEDTSGAEGRGVVPRVVRRVQDDGVIEVEDEGLLR